MILRDAIKFGSDFVDIVVKERGIEMILSWIHDEEVREGESRWTRVSAYAQRA